MKGPSDKCVVIKKVIIDFFKRKYKYPIKDSLLCNQLIYSVSGSPILSITRVYTLVCVNCTFLSY